MKTPENYKENLKKRTITRDMLLDALYSCNKRAKNYRDKEREYRNYSRNNRYFYNKYDNIGKAREKKEEYYRQKQELLSVLNPSCIHVETLGYEKRRIYDYEKADYKKNRNNFVWENCYWDYEKCREVWFGDIEEKNKPIIHHYLFYDVLGDLGHTFHTPIDNPDDYKDLERIEIGRLTTEGHDINDLISNQFVTKVIELIRSGNYKLEL